MCVCVPACMQVPIGTRKGHQIPVELENPMWVLETELGSLEKW